VQTILWGQPAGEAGVLTRSVWRGALHRSKVYVTGVGTRSQSGPALKGSSSKKRKKSSPKFGVLILNWPMLCDWFFCCFGLLLAIMYLSFTIECKAEID
jgi:hypothetical protein